MLINLLKRFVHHLKYIGNNVLVKKQDTHTKKSMSVTRSGGRLPPIDQPPRVHSALILASIVLVISTCTAQFTHTPSLSMCPVSDRPPRPYQCPMPVLSNITDFGPWSYNGTNKYNKSWDINWVTDYNKTIDDRSLNMHSCDANPYNYFERECEFYFNCNATNQTKSVVNFYEMNVTVDVGDLLITQLLIDVEFTQVTVGYNNTMFNTSLLRYVNIISPLFQEPGRPAFMMNNFSKRGFTITSNSMQYAVTRVRFFVPTFQTDTTMQDYVKFNLSAHYECNVRIQNITVYYTDDFKGGLGLALGIPIAVILLLLLIAALRYLGCCKCCDDKKDGKEGVDDESAIRKQQQKRDGLSQPLNIENRAGMQTWLDQADEVVADLNQNCLYLEEAKADTAMNKELDTVTGTGGSAANPAFSAQKDGYLGDRRLYAVGGAQVTQKDHKVTMQTRSTDQDEFVL